MKRILTHLSSSLCSFPLTSGLRSCRHVSTNGYIHPNLVTARIPRLCINNTRHESTNNKTNDRDELQHGVYEMKDPESEDQVVNITVTNKDGKVFKLRGKIGDNLLYLAKRFEVEMEGACEASLACTTCHVYVEGGYYDKLEPPLEKEEDLLDMAPFLKENSRLGCQIILNKDLEGLKVRLPHATKNFYVDGHKPGH